MERKALSFFLAFVMAFMIIPAKPAAAPGSDSLGLGISSVTFTTNSQINLKDPSDLVFETTGDAILAGEGYTFDSIFIKNITLGLGNGLDPRNGISYANGMLTIPAALFGQHQGVYPLQAGRYQAEIRFFNGADYISFTVDFTMKLILDTAKDALFTFPGNYEDLVGVYLNGARLDQSDINGTSAHLSGYGGYGHDPLGRVEAGSIIVTLFKDFLQALASGTYYLEIELKDGSRYGNEFEIPLIKNPPSTLDLGEDAFHKFNGDYDKLDDVLLNGVTLRQSPIAGRRAMYLSGYGNYNGYLGLAEPGSVNVTLYKEFLKTLPGGTYVLTVRFLDGTMGELPFIIQQQPTPPSVPNDSPTPDNSPAPDSFPAPDDSSGSDKVDTVVESLWLERGEAQLLASRAKAKGDQSVRTVRTGKYGVRGNAWDRLTGLRYYHDTMVDGKIQVRLYVDEPLKMKKDTLVSAYTAGGWVKTTKSKFQKYFANKLQVVHFDQQAEWTQSVRVAAKLDLTGMDPKKLRFYSYDRKSNSYKRIGAPSYWIDKNGYLHFATEFAGDIIVSEGLLELK